ncbi:MAG: hypothetical protein IKW00_00745 [Clostridia bacterium]|nr:hypothetical protein [Clostridia bacterium]
MEALAYVAMFAALIAGILLLVRYYRERQKELYRIEALRQNRVYKDMYPLV